MTRAWLVMLLAGTPLLAQTAPPAGPLSYPVPTIVDPNRKLEAKPGSAPAMAPAKSPNPAAGVARTAGPAAAPAAGPSYKDLKYPPLRPVQIPKVDSTTLANGMRLYLLEDHELPLVNGTALVHTGMLLDPPEKVGLANLTATVMRTGGTRTATADQLNERRVDSCKLTPSAVAAECSGSTACDGNCNSLRLRKCAACYV